MRPLRNLLDDLISGDDRRAQAAAQQFAEFDETALEPVLDLARTGDPDERWWAVCALVRSPHPRTDQLVPFLNDPEPAVRQAVILGLADRTDPALVEALIKALADENALVSRLAANALTGIGVAAVPALITAMESPPMRARIMALRALAEIKDHRAIPTMMKVMREDSALLQHWAKEGLERLGLDMVYIKP